MILLSLPSLIVAAYASQSCKMYVGAANVVTGEHRSYWQAVKTWWNTKSYNSLRMIIDNKRVCGYHMGLLKKTPELIQDATNQLLELYKDGRIRPQIDSVWAFEDVS